MVLSATHGSSTRPAESTFATGPEGSCSRGGSSAVVFGRAQSVYFHYEDEEYRGKNVSYGDSISISFDKGKVKDIWILSKANGTYFGQPGEVKKEPEAE